MVFTNQQRPYIPITAASFVRNFFFLRYRVSTTDITHFFFLDGHPKCQNPLKYNTKLQAEMGELYQRTLARSNLLRSQGYNLVEQWECLWKASEVFKTLKKNENIDMGPLIPEDAYHGRRLLTYFFFFF